MIKNITVFFLCLSIFFCYAEKFNITEYNNALLKLEQGGLPVIVVHVRNLSKFIAVKKHLLENESFMALNGKKFHFFFIDSSVYEFTAMKNIPSVDSVYVYHKEKWNNGGFHLHSVPPEKYAEQLVMMTRKRPEIFQTDDFRKVHDLVKQGKLSYQTFDRDGTHALYYFLSRYIHPDKVRSSVILEMIDMVKSQNLSGEFWSRALWIHTKNNRYFAKKHKAEWIQITDALLKAGANPNYADEYGISTAYYLLHNGDFHRYHPAELKMYLPFFEKLISAGLDLNRVYPNKNFPHQSPVITYEGIKIPAEGLHVWASNYDSFPLWDDRLALIDKLKLEVNAVSGRLFYDIIFTRYARKTGKSKLELIKDLLKRGASVNSQYDSENTVMTLLAEKINNKEYRELFFYLLQNGADPNLIVRYVKDGLSREKTIFSALKFEYQGRREVVEALLKAGINPRLLNCTSAVYYNNEDLALYILEKGGKFGELSSSDRKRYPRLAAAISKLPRDLKFTDLNDPNLLHRKTLQRDRMILGESEDEKRILSDALALLEKYAGKNTKGLYFSFSWTPRSDFNCIAIQKAYRDCVGCFADRSFLINTLHAENDQQRMACNVKTAAALVDNTCSLLCEVPFRCVPVCYGDELETIYLKALVISDLGALFKYTSRLYKFLPECNDAAFDHLSPSAAACLKQKLDEIPAGYDNKQICAEIDKIIKNLMTAYWCGEAPADAPELQQEIEFFWQKYYAAMKRSLDAYSKYNTKEQHRKICQDQFFSSTGSNDLTFKFVPEFCSALRFANEYVNWFTLIDVRNNKTFADSSVDMEFYEKIRKFKNSFAGPAKARKNFALFLDFMVSQSESCRLLKMLPANLFFMAGNVDSIVFDEKINHMSISTAKLERLSSLQEDPECAVALAAEFVQVMSQYEQQLNGVRKYYYDSNNQEEYRIKNFLVKLYPHFRVFLLLQDLQKNPDYMQAAADMIASQYEVFDFAYKQHSSWWNKLKWHEELVKIYWEQDENSQYRQTIFRNLNSWEAQARNLACYGRSVRKESFKDMNEFLKTYHQMMQIELDLTYFLENDPVTKAAVRRKRR
ncbi:MAG: hypothetical protein IJW05_00975 [Lentisphaeria bacterium]|nr:hypothetical protein [Lentisphaeria bacterium]